MVNNDCPDGNNPKKILAHMIIDKSNYYNKKDHRVERNQASGMNDPQNDYVPGGHPQVAIRGSVHTWNAL